MKWFRRVSIVAMSLVAGVGLSACGSSASTTPTTTSPTNQVAYLCQVIPRVDRLIVTRRAPGNQNHFTFPAVVTVTNAAAARAVAAAACALPEEPKGVRQCPAEFAISYNLDFAVKGEKGMGGEAININPTGCELVTGLGTVRTTSNSPHFYQSLGTAMGLRNPSYHSFVLVYAKPV